MRRGQADPSLDATADYGYSIFNAIFGFSNVVRSVRLAIDDRDGGATLGLLLQLGSNPRVGQVSLVREVGICNDCFSIGSISLLLFAWLVAWLVQECWFECWLDPTEGSNTTLCSRILLNIGKDLGHKIRDLNLPHCGRPTGTFFLNTHTHTFLCAVGISKVEDDHQHTCC